MSELTYVGTNWSCRGRGFTFMPTHLALTGEEGGGSTRQRAVPNINIFCIHPIVVHGMVLVASEILLWVALMMMFSHALIFQKCSPWSQIALQ